MADIFISYSRQNDKFARQLMDRLVLKNKDVWIDWEDINTAAENWWDEIKEGIDGADNFLFIVSSHSRASLICNMELNYAFERNKRIIPIIYEEGDYKDAFEAIIKLDIDNAMRERLNGENPIVIATNNEKRLSHINWLFYRESDDFNEAFDRLLQAININIDYVKEHTRYLLRAEDWNDAEKLQDLLLFGKAIDRAEEWQKKGRAYRANEKAQEYQKPSDTYVPPNPLPNQLQEEYISASRLAENERQQIAKEAEQAAHALEKALQDEQDAKEQAKVASEQAVQAAKEALQAAQRQKQIRNGVGVFLVGFMIFTFLLIPTLTQQIESLTDAITARNDALNQQFASLAPTIDDVEIARSYCVTGILTTVVERDSVLQLCDRMVELSPFINKWFYGDIRGIAYAQAGDINGAIEDFSNAIAYYEAHTPNCTEILDRREQWINELEQGNNPFLTDSELDISTTIQIWFEETEPRDCM